MKLPKVKKLRKKCIELGFIGVDILDKYSNRELTSICNGIGADWFPKSVRKLIDWICEYLQATAFQHDIEFEAQIGFEVANAHFLINGRKEVKAKYKWYNPKRYIALRRARQFYILLEYFGYPAYLQAMEKKFKNKKSTSKKRKRKTTQKGGSDENSL